MEQVPDLQHYTTHTIGHGNRNIEVFLFLLKEYNIELLIDVRSFPYSRYNPQFRRSQLESELTKEGLKYLFFGKELGGRPSDPTLYKNKVLDHSLVKQTSLFKEGIEKVVELVKEGIKVTLMCSESNPDDCHRKHLIADELVKAGLIVWHIDKVGELQKHISEVKPSLFD